MKRLFRIRVAIMVIVIIFYSSSCSTINIIPPEENEGEDNNKKITLRFMSSWGGVDSKADTLQQILDNFTEKNNNIEIINASTSGEDFLSKIKIDFASGNDPDVFGLWPGSDIRALVRAGKVADLTDVLAEDPEWSKSFNINNWSYSTYNGRIYGIPLEIIFEALYINTDIFEEYNVKIPLTYDELKNAIITFRKNDIIPIAFNATAEGSYLYQNIIAMLGGTTGVENPFKNGEVNRCYIDAIDYLKEMYELNAFPTDAFTLTSIERNRLFIEKKAAMIVQGSWFIGDLKDNEETVDIIPFPWIQTSGSRPGMLVYGFGNGVFYISENAWRDPNKREASIELLKALTSLESATLLVKQTGMISNLRIPDDGENGDKLMFRGLELIKNAREFIGPPDSFLDRRVWEDIIVKRLIYALEDRDNAEDIWDEAMRKSRIY